MLPAQNQTAPVGACLDFTPAAYLIAASPPAHINALIHVLKIHQLLAGAQKVLDGELAFKHLRCAVGRRGCNH